MVKTALAVVLMLAPGMVSAESFQDWMEFCQREFDGSREPGKHQLKTKILSAIDTLERSFDDQGNHTRVFVERYRVPQHVPYLQTAGAPEFDLAVIHFRLEAIKAFASMNGLPTTRAEYDQSLGYF